MSFLHKPNTKLISSKQVPKNECSSHTQRSKYWAFETLFKSEKEREREQTVAEDGTHKGAAGSVAGKAEEAHYGAARGTSSHQ